MTTPTDERPDLITVVAHMKAAPGKRAELLAELEKAVAASKSDEGFVNYDLHEGLDDPDLFVFYENWETAEDLAAHGRSPHLAALGQAIATGLVDENGLTVHRLHRIA